MWDIGNSKISLLIWSKKMAEVMIWDPLERFLGGIAITLAGLSAILYIYRSREHKDRSERLLVLGYGILCIGATVLLTFYYFLQFFLSGSFTHYNFYIDNSNIDLNYLIIERLGWLFFFIIYSLHVFAHEKVIIKRTKYSFTVLLMVLIVLMSITIPYDIFDTLQTLCYGFLGLIVTIFLIIMIRRSNIELKAVGAFLLTALVMISLSIRFLSIFFKELNIIPLFLPQLFIIIGWILVIVPILVKPSRLARANYYWIGSAIIISVFLSFTFILYILVRDITKLFSLTIYVIISIYAVYDTLGSIKALTLKKSSSELKKNVKSPLDPFIRPQIITEEEVTVSKEKKVCLVCKVKLERGMYICPDCYTFYCKKCSDTLKDLENVCWVCNTPFDEFKPSKPFKDEEKEEKIEISGKNRKDY